MRKFGLTILLLIPLSLTAQVTRTSTKGDTVNYSVDEIDVVGRQSISAPQSVQMSAVEIPLLQLQTIPALGGEIDVLKAIQLLPGVQSATDGSTGIYVRGGGADENLILLDGVPLYNVSHAAGMFSVFNADILESVTLYKGNFPARFGSRLSSVIDVTQRDGSPGPTDCDTLSAWHGGVSIGSVAAKIHLRGQIASPRTTFALAARRTYFDALLSPLMAIYSSSTLEGTGSAVGGYYFFDVNGKIVHRFQNNDRLSGSFYMGDDIIYVRYNLTEELDDYRQWSRVGLRWTSGNIMAKIQYDHRINEALSMQVHTHFLRFGFQLSEQLKAETTDASDPLYGNYALDQSLDYRSKLYDAVARTDFLYENDRHTVRFGAGYEMHAFRPQIGNLMLAELGGGIGEFHFDTIYTTGTTFGHEAYIYAEDTYEPLRWLSLNYGLRAALYGIGGKVYPSIEPRLGIRALVHKDVALKASYSYMSQYVHLLSNTSISSPTDLWVPVTANIPPMRSMQVAAGISYDICKQVELSVEGYYKRSVNLMEYKDGATFFGVSSGWEEKVALGDGWSYGVELLLQRKHGPVTGWIGYTWSRTMRQFNREGMVINHGEPYHAKYDREHDLSVTLQYRITKKFEIAGTFIYGTGNRATLALQRYYSKMEHEWVGYVSERNNFVMPAYHRLDLSANWHLPSRKNGDPTRSKKGWLRDAEHLISVMIYNVYCHKNPYMMIIAGNELKQISLFPILPSISYAFKF